jgi:hypothetical protein
VFVVVVVVVVVVVGVREVQAAYKSQVLLAAWMLSSRNQQQRQHTHKKHQPKLIL